MSVIKQRKGRAVMKKIDEKFERIRGWYLAGSRLRRLMLTGIAIVLATVFVFVARSAPEGQNSGQSNTARQSGAADWKAVEQALGKAGSVQPGNVYKVSLPRGDLQ